MILQIEKHDLETLFEQIAAKTERVPEVMTAAQVAEYFGVSVSSVRKWMRAKENPIPHGYFGNDPRFFVEDVKRWAKGNAERKTRL